MPLEYALQASKGLQNAGPWKHYLKAKRTSIRFNVMIAGETGLGKKTFINTLFQSDVFDIKQGDVSAEQYCLQDVMIHPVTCMLEEEDVRMVLTAIDTPGFGNRCDRRKDLEPILQYIDDQYRAYHEMESGIQSRKTRNQQDTRVHLCFYFIYPTGQCLKELDIVSLQALSAKVNLIPLIAKADTLTDQERAMFKKRISMDLKNHDIKIYPIDYPNKDRVDLNFKSHMPFCVIGSDDMITVDGKQVRGREYSYGKVLVEHPGHSDMFKLREMLMGHLMHELGDLTHDLHYRLYRTQHLLKGKSDQGHLSGLESLLPCDDEYEVKLLEFESAVQNEMYAKEERIKAKYVEKVRSAEARLYEWEQELAYKKREFDEDLAQQCTLLEQTRLLLDQEDQHQSQW